MMSVEEEVGGDDIAEKKFWGTPELVEKLTTYLDLASIKQLAESHKLTRQILGKELTWNRLIKKTFPKDPNMDMWANNYPEEGDPVLASERSKARVLAAILSLSEDSDKPQLEMDLVHTICDRHALLDPNTWRLIDVACSCLQTHTVSIWGFLLLQEAQSGEQGILVVDRVKGPLNGLLFTALGSLLFDRQGKVNTLDVN